MTFRESNRRPQSVRWSGLLLFLSLRIASAATASSNSLVRPARVAFYRRGGGGQSPLSSKSFLSRRRRPPTTATSVGLKRSQPKSATKQDLTKNYSYDPPSQSGEALTVEEARAQLGPVGFLVANSLELAVVTIGSYVSGGALGYVGGTVMGIPSTLFGREMGGVVQRLSALNSKAFASCKSWAALSAAFSGFHNFVIMCRGGAEDGWNAVIGSALTGAFLNRAGGLQAMIQGGATYAGFTYVLDKLFASPSSRQYETSS
eukprot:CAMPEP_0172533708 /NCGR_PEP_ID=MMETSP1067-20121228/6314_1 /TAXON_ID=265564 ORGANISM="Thalassiosira punctigera, Strain Tpunct2005C2" /NCGR_SAMPLE_ID=MMETSP1067 /ASSEMBLY_ACC=CAM_ASM_000444 /LENGTH=259 /DNA_ID=CAMNT_0013318381 /DNA_START=80 /DNA_END=859 /DNA_ORIENTATION=+